MLQAGESLPGIVLSVVIALLGTAGLSKFWDLSAFESSLQTWNLFPAFLRMPAVALVPVAEVAVALFWFGGRRGHGCIVALVAMLFLFSVAISIQTYFGSPPDCGCFALVQEWFEGRAGAQRAIVRNGVLLSVVLVSWRYYEPAVIWNSSGQFEEARL